MTRPQSRGMGGPAGPRGMGETGLGPLQMQPPNLAATRLGTAQLLGTAQGGGGRVTGTRQAQQQFLGVGTHSEVKVNDRPTTMQGLSGMKTGSLGPKRQVYDKTFYMVELRKRCKELQEEVLKLNKEIEDTREDNQLYVSLDKRYESLVSTVRQLEGDLADHNLATDKQRTDTRPEEVHHMYLIMKQQNDQQRNDVDQIFLENKSHEEEIGRMHEEVLSITRAAEARLNELHPDQRYEYQCLRQEQTQLAEELAGGRMNLDQIQNHLSALEQDLASDGLRMHSQELLALQRKVHRRLEEIEVEAEQCNRSVPEQRDYLLAAVKADNAEIILAEKSNSALKLEKERLRSLIQEVSTDAKEQKDDNDQHKYEILFAKDQEMTKFIDNFDDCKLEEEKKMKEKQASIVFSLENISKSVGHKTGGGLLDHMKDVEDELDFKSQQLVNAETTQNRLEGELAKRSAELEKIDGLDAKITSELHQVEAKIRDYEHEMASKFDHVAEIQAQGETLLKRLRGRRQHLEGILSVLKQQVGFLRLKNDSKKQQLQDDKVSSAIDGQEKKIQQFGQTLHALTSFISEKSAETDVQAEFSACVETANFLNRMLVERRIPVT